MTTVRSILESRARDTCPIPPATTVCEHATAYTLDAVSPLPSRAAARAAFVVMTILFALWVLPSRNYPLGANAEASPEKLARGTAATPYQYRVLIPWLVTRGTPAKELSGAEIKARYWWTEFIALVGLGLVFRRYLAFFIDSYGLTCIFALSLFALLQFNFRLQDYYPYDIPSMLFFTAGLIFIYEGKWWWFYPLFAVATLNRETSLFLTLATALVWFDRQPRLRTVGHVAVQGLLWLTIKWLLFDAYRGNPSGGYGLFQPQLKMNIMMVLGQPATALIALSTWAYLWIPVAGRYNRIRHRQLRRTLLIVPCVVVAMLPVGVINEVRIYAEVLPVVLAAAAVIFVDYLQQVLVQNPDPLRSAE